MFPHVEAESIGWLTEAQMIEVDRVMIEDLHIELIQMMENAGRNLAQFVIEHSSPNSVTVLAGSGGNGGGGMVAARHLANRGVDVSLALSRPPDDFGGVPGHQLDILQRMGVSVVESDRLPGDTEVIIDALIGYSLKGAPRGRLGELVEWANTSNGSTVALDTPTGLDVTDGSTPGQVISVDATLTLALPKVGLRGHPAVGDLYVADISVPPAVYEAMNAGPAPDFSRSPVLRVS